MANKPLSEMSVEEQAAAYKALVEKRQAKQVTGKAKRAAIKALIAAHKPEFDKLVADAQKHSGK